MPQTLKEQARQFAATHDAMCAELLADLARGHAIVLAILPAKATAELLGLPEAVAASFIDAQLGAIHADRVVRYLLGADGRLYILLEHKSYPDRYSLMQMHGYHAGIWRTEADGSRAPLPVIPILLYNGARPWEEMPNLAELIEGGGEMRALARRHTPSYRPLRVDMKDVPLRRLARSPGAWAGWSAMVCCGQQRISRPQLRAILRRLGRGTDFEAKTIWYIAAYCGREPRMFGMIADTVREVTGKERGGDIMDAVDPVELAEHPWFLRGRDEGRAEGMAQGREQGIEQGIAQGREQGMAQGREQGMAQGREQGKAETLLSQLRLKFGDLPPGAQAEVKAADARQLDIWAAAVLTATSLEELLAAKP